MERPKKINDEYTLSGEFNIEISKKKDYKAMGIKDDIQQKDQLFEKLTIFIKDTLMDVKIEKNEINEVILVGGSTKIPKIKSLLTEFFEIKNRINTLNDKI